MKTLKFLLFFNLLFFASIAFSQNKETDTTSYIIVKNDGVEYVAKILSDDGREILLLTDKLGKIYIPKHEIRSISKVDYTTDFSKDEYRGRGVFTTRYQFTTNSFPIKKGENYSMINLFGPEVHFSVSNRFSIGVMATWIASPFIIAMKYSIPTKNEKLNFGFGTLLGSSGYLLQSKGYGGLHWGMMTYGDRNNNVTLSLGYSYFNSGIKYNNSFLIPGTYDAIYNSNSFGSEYNFNFDIPYSNQILEKSKLTKAPIIGIAGISKIAKNVSFIFDAMALFGKSVNKNYSQDYLQVYDKTGLVPDYTLVGPIVSKDINVKSNNIIIMPGMRFQKSENKAFQIALAGIIGRKIDENGSSGYSFPIPMCSWFYKF